MKYIEVLLKIYSYLKEKEVVKNQKEFAEIIGESKTGWGDLKSEKKRVTITHLRKIADQFKDIRLEFLILGEGEIIDSTRANPLSQEYIQQQAEMIELLKEKIKNLESFKES